MDKTNYILLIVPTPRSFDWDKKYKIYYCPAESNGYYPSDYLEFNYLGFYKNSSIRTISKVENWIVADFDYISGELELHRYKKTVTPKQQKRLISALYDYKLIDRKPYSGYKFYLLDEDDFADIDFRKSSTYLDPFSKGAKRGYIRANLAKFFGGQKPQNDRSESIAELIKGRTWPDDANQISHPEMNSDHTTKESKNMNEMEEYIDLLRANHNLILTGAPGTGKTYLAKQIAQEIGAETEFVQFHPSYDYTDFVEGLRPSTKDGHGQITFERQDGTFMAFCKRAAKDSEHDYVFIIDEINRAEPSRVFGELFFALEPSYRGTAGTVTTQYANLAKGEAMPKVKPGEFYVPENIYIIGTMNDIDRSVDSIDFAMRRRFVWKEINAEEQLEIVLADLPDDTEQSDSWRKAAIRGLSAINEYIDDRLPQLGKAYHIGPAYMLKLKSYASRQKNGSEWKWEEYNLDHKAWVKIWNFHLQPLLTEYLRGMPDLQDHLNGLEEAYWS